MKCPECNQHHMRGQGMNVHNRLATSYRRWQLRWQESQWDIIVALIFGLTLVLVLLMLGGVWEAGR
jgi:hypothetical protein